MTLVIVNSADLVTKDTPKGTEVVNSAGDVWVATFADSSAAQRFIDENKDAGHLNGCSRQL